MSTYTAREGFQVRTPVRLHTFKEFILSFLVIKVLHLSVCELLMKVCMKLLNPFRRLSRQLSFALSSAFVVWWHILQTIWTQIRQCSLRSSLIRLHSVCFYDKLIWAHLNTADIIRRQHFLEIGAVAQW